LKNIIRTYGSVLLAIIFWSFSFIWFKIANETYLPLTIVFSRLVIAVLLLSTFLLLTRGFIKIKKADRKYFLILALFEPFFYFLGESYGLTYVSATVGSVIISLIPVISALGAWIFLREKLSIMNYAGIVLSFIGIIVFIINKDGNTLFNLKGIALLFLAVVSAVGFNLTLGRLVGTYNPVFIVTVQNIIGVILFLPVFLITDFHEFINTPLVIKSFIPIIELSVFASCGAFILFAYSIKKIGVSRANVFTNCIPIFTAVFSFYILGDRLTMQNIAGMVIVITGLFLSQINGRKKKIDEGLALTGKTA
jgi:drug/metabolite transporter (DMT)-like permease